MPPLTAWKAPILFIHGEKDFRIPYTQGIAGFTAAQRRGVESRLVIFPDENHWTLKPKNSMQWYGEVLGWLGKYAPTGVIVPGCDRAAVKCRDETGKPVPR